MFRGDLPGAKGYGAALDRSTSALKAVMEAIESIALVYSKIEHQSRSGTAAHFSKEEARNKAYWELIERDAFMFHWLSEEPGVTLTALESEAARTVSRNTALSGLSITKLASADPGVNVVLAVCKHETTNCFCIGLGSSPSFGEAVEQAIRETQVYFSTHMLTGMCPSDAIRSGGEPDSATRHRLIFADHHIGTRETKIAGLLQHISQGSCEFKRPNIDGIRERIEFTDLPSISNKVHVVRAKSPDLLPIFFGKEFVNRGHDYRVLLKESAGKTYRFHNQKKFLPHPLD